MRERPILFSGPMVQAILDGHKTVTRRVVKPQPDSDGGPPLATGWFHPETADGGPGPHTFGVYGVDWHVRCPYGAPGDRLWVRETWSARDERGFWAASTRDVDQERDEIVYHAPCLTPRQPAPPRWLSPLYMPRWASRITLEVVSVRVERLQEITEIEALREGCPTTNGGLRGQTLQNAGASSRDNFRLLWDQINGERAPWASNPWVWRVDVRRVPW